MKIDNSFFTEKVNLRIDAIKNIKRPIILECFAGESKIWDKVQKITGKNLIVLRIEKEKNKGNRIYLQGDNLKYLKGMDLTKYNIIDLDSYGIPFKQLEILFKKQYKGIVIVTAIQSVIGCLPHELLLKNRYTKLMIRKIPTLFYRHGLEKLKNYLYLKGIKSITGYFINQKNYFYFQT